MSGPWTKLILAPLIAIGIGSSAPAASAARHPAAPWPQWNGPNRTGVSNETGLLAKWPRTGPRRVWAAKGLGSGYSTVSVAGGQLFTMGNRGDDEMIIALDARTGKELWATRNGPAFSNDRGDGPRGTPTVDGDVLYAEGASGDLSCLSTDTGTVRWHVNILERFGAQPIMWGQAESPLVEGAKVIVTPGGRGATLAALDKATGATIWTAAETPSSTEQAAHASAIAATICGIRQIVQFTKKGVIGVRADDGKFLWRYDHPANRVTNTLTPIVRGNYVFASSAYHTGCGLVELIRKGDEIEATEVYFHQKLIQSHHGGVVLVGDYLYGSSGGNDGRPWPLVCMEFLTGKVVWQNRSIGKSSLVCADGKLFLYSENGVVGLVKATPDGYHELGRFAIRKSTRQHTWSHPVVAAGRLYLRDQDNLYCYDVAAR